MKRLKYWLLLLPAVFFQSSCFGGETIDIAAIYALTGAAAQSNAYSLQGVRLGVDELNTKGGILSKRLNLLVFDNQSSPIGSSVAAEQAAAANVVAILGSVWSSHSIPIAKVAQEKAIPMISNFSTHMALTEIGDYIFRVCFTDDFQGEAMARFARQEFKAKTAVVFVNLTSDYSLGLSRLFRQAFEKLGGRVLGEMEYKPKYENLAPLLLRTKEMNADVVFVAGQDESGLIVKRLQDAGVRSIALGGDGWSEESFLNHGGKDLELGYYCSHWSESSESQRSRAFVSKYQETGQFGVGTALAYDALMLLADAIERAGSVEKEKIRDALANTTAFEGVTGTIGFNAQRNPVKSAVIMKVSKGERSYFKTLGP